MSLIDFTLFIVLLISGIIAIMRFRVLQNRERIIAILLILTFPQVLICFILFKQRQSNLELLRWYSLIEFGLLMAYYKLLLYKRRFRNIPILFMIIGILWFTLPFIFKKPFLHNFSFLLFESLTVIVVGLLYCLDLFFREKDYIMQLASFWITIALLVYWTTTYTRYGLLIFHDRVSPHFLAILEYSFFFINIIFYASLAGIIFNYDKFLKNRG